MSCISMEKGSLSYVFARVPLLGPVCKASSLLTPRPTPRPRSLQCRASGCSHSHHAPAFLTHACIPTLSLRAAFPHPGALDLLVLIIPCCGGESRAFQEFPSPVASAPHMPVAFIPSEKMTKHSSRRGPGTPMGQNRPGWEALI